MSGSIARAKPLRVWVVANEKPYRVFISHASADLWVARQIEAHVRGCGAATFLDALHVEKGDDFEDRIIEAAQGCDELVVLLTPTALQSRYVFMEIGMFLVLRKRVVTVLYGLQPDTLASDPQAPLAIKRLQLVDINDIDAYFAQLTGRATSEARNG